MLTSMPTPLMIACHPEWRLQWRPYGCGLMVQCWMFSWFHRCIQWRCRVVRGRSQEKQNWVWYDMFANVHGWIVRPRFRTVCGTMRQNSVRHALKSHVAHGYCIGCAECGRWHVRAGVRYLGMGWCWQHPAMRYAARRWLRFPRRDIPDRDLPPSCPTSSFPFQAPADFKKMRRCHCCTVFSFFFFHARHTAGEEPFLKREEECRKRRFAHGSFLLRELIWKWEHIVVSVCSHRK